MYGIETWVVNKQQVSKNRMMDKVRNVEIRVKLGVGEGEKESSEMKKSFVVRECKKLVQGRRGRGWPRKK